MALPITDPIVLDVCSSLVDFRVGGVLGVDLRVGGVFGLTQGWDGCCSLGTRPFTERKGLAKTHACN